MDFSRISKHDITMVAIQRGERRRRWTFVDTRRMLLVALILAVSVGSRLSLAFSVEVVLSAPRNRRLSGLESHSEPQLEEHYPEISVDEIDLISTLVQKRAEARRCGDYKSADSIRDEIISIDLPDCMEVVIEDIPRRDGGGSLWRFQRNSPVEPIEGPTVLQLAHAALGLAMASSEGKVPTPEHELTLLVTQARDRIKMGGIVDVELRGRKAADAAFWFALAGVTDESLMQSLASISASELERFGARSSCRAKDVWQILERMAAAGLKYHLPLQEAAKRALDAKREETSEQADTESLLDFYSGRCRLMLWKFSTKQRKQRAFLQSAVAHWEHHKLHATRTAPIQQALSSKKYEGISWSDVYSDPTRPLVIDVGCGMGVSLLGLSNNCSEFPVLADWSECNFAGVDLSGLAIGYGRGLAKRWGLEDRLNFSVDSAENFLQRVVDSYPGPVELCLVQFPTPFRLAVSRSGMGNSQLPSDFTDGFMVTKALLQLVRDALCKGDTAKHGNLLLQSNCEDVAVWMQHTACEDVGFQAVADFDVPEESNEHEVTVKRIPKRTLDWIAMGGKCAEGEGWSKIPLLPRSGWTETEVACMMNGTPVHRTLLTPASIDSNFQSTTNI